LTLKLISDRGLWDKFVETSPNGLIFHRWDFLKVIEKHSKYQLLPYGVYLGNELICVYPLFYRRYNGLKMLFSPPPGSSIPYLGFVMCEVYDSLKQRRKELYINTVADDIEREIGRISPNYVSIDTPPKFLDIRPFKWNGYNVDVHFNYLISLEKPLDKIWANFGKDCRERIRQFEKFDVVLKESDDIDAYYELEKKMYEEQGLSVPVMSKEYLQEIFHAFPDNLKLFFLYKDGEVVDTEAAYSYKDKYKLLWSVSSINKKMYGNQEYSTWELIKKAKAEGYKEFEIVGANVRRFCRYQVKFNPSLDMCFTIAKMDTIGAIAEWSYMNIIRRKFRSKPAGPAGHDDTSAQKTAAMQE
jgi:Acetyltransferase (GNAT) domain